MRKVLNSVYLLAMVSMLVLLVFTSNKTRSKVICESIEVEVDTRGDLFFLTEEMIVDLVAENQDSLVGSSFEDINIFLLEENVNMHPNIDKAELYLSLNGKLCINVKQRKPIARVFEENQSYYLDDQIDPIPLSDRYTARVLHVYWDEKTISRSVDLSAILKYLSEDKFLKAQITAIEFDENDEVIMYPRIGDHKIVLGSALNLTKKFEKLKVFYREGLEKVGWDRYSHINLKFENQVVCTKR
jgi:cell division protein FtsQ